MAAYSKAEKRKAKRGRGRPRKEGVLRTPSGQISRAKEPPAKVAQLARMRIFGMTASEALSDLAGDNGVGGDILYTRRQFVMHPYGIAWQDASVTGEFPTNVELATAANWNRVYPERKQVPISFLVTNG